MTPTQPVVTPTYEPSPSPTSTPIPKPLNNPDSDSLLPKYELKFDGSRFDTVSASVDIIGMGGDIASNFGPPGKLIWVASEIPELLTLGRIWDATESGDPSGALAKILHTGLVILKLVPNAGFVGNTISLIANIANCFYLEQVNSQGDAKK